MAAKKKTVEAQFKDIIDKTHDAVDLTDCSLEEYIWGLGLLKASVTKWLEEAQDEYDSLTP